MDAAQQPVEILQVADILAQNLLVAVGIDDEALALGAQPAGVGDVGNRQADEADDKRCDGGDQMAQGQHE